MSAGAVIQDDDDESFLRQALNPVQSVVVEACAGSGKTWLLVSRIVRLLLAGVEPSQILAITYTRKGAQEMRARLTDSLRLLATAPDFEVLEFLRQRRLPETELPSALTHARCLFETCLAAEPGVTIDTFHGWFLQLLERAPFSARHASLPADFTLDERASLLLDEAWDLFGGVMEQAGEGALAAGFRSLAAEHGYDKVRMLLGRFLDKRAEWWAYTRDAPDPVAFALAELAALLGVDPQGDPVRALADDLAIAAMVRQLTAVDAGRSKTQSSFADELAAAMRLTDPLERFEALFASCHTRQGEPSKLLEKFYVRQDASLGLCFDEFRRGLEAAREAQLEHDVYRLHQRVLPCAVRLLEIFQQLKRGRQVIDFTDIEWHAYRLLADSEDAAFMHAKLDSRYRHILLDEFQDTNPLQWQALRAWLDAYGADAGRPTVFLVGDPKQSIYRFRRAEPRLFQVAAETLVRDYGAQRLATNKTRRCPRAIVDVVNCMFAGSAEYPGFRPHSSLVDNAEGYAEVFPLASGGLPAVPAPENAQLAWRNPLQQALPETEDKRRAVEAAALAARIRDIVGRQAVPSAAGNEFRPARYSDVMILKRNRTQLAVYEHALRAQGIPFLTSRHGGLLDTLEAADLCALIEVLIAPFDDLKLAHALRSPVFGCTDDDLVRLAQLDVVDTGAARTSWWRRLEMLVDAAPPASAALRRAQVLLAAWRSAADTEPVHDLLDRIYHEGEVLYRYRAASPAVMVAQVAVNLERFLELALDLDSGRYPSLPRFVAELTRMRVAPDQEAPDEGTGAGAGEVFGAGEAALDAVRIYTVHGAKGLEAPVVFLIDANGSERVESNDVLVDWDPEAEAPRHFSLFTTGAERGRKRAPMFSVQAGLARRERLNLLYVAATRARHSLLVSGIENERGHPPDGSAYVRVAAALSTLAGEAPDTPGGRVRGCIVTANPGDRMLVAEGAGTPAGPPPRPTGKAYGARLVQTPQARAGIHLHAILEQLTSVPAGQNAGASARVRRILALPEAEFAPLRAQAQSIVGAEALRRFFDPAFYLRAENEIEVIAGDALRRIDRLVEFDDEVWILDYKSGDIGDRAAWRDQLADYRSLLKPLFAGKKLHSAVVLPDGSLEEFADRD